MFSDSMETRRKAFIVKGITRNRRFYLLIPPSRASWEELEAAEWYFDGDENAIVIRLPSGLGSIGIDELELEQVE